MKLQKHGKNTSKIEVTHVSMNGLWILVNETEYFLSFKKHPWFRDAKISEIHFVEFQHQHILRWPDLDVDIDLESLDFPEKYPLTYQK